MTGAAEVPKLDDVPASVAHAVAEALGDAYDCTRTWSAWRHGTMGPGDFYQVAEDGDRVAEIALAAITAWEAGKPKPDGVPAMYQVRPRSFQAGEGWREVSERDFDNYGDFPGYPDAEWERRKLYATPQPAPAIDLEKFRRLAHGWVVEAGGVAADVKHACADELLALIDGQANPNGPKFRGRSTHRVYRGGSGYLPCYCHADADHMIGDEQPTKGEGE